MQVTQKRFEDAGERDANGDYDYYYSGVIYHFQFASRALIVRRYDDTPGEASFLRCEIAPDGAPAMFTEIPYRDREFREAAAYLRDKEGVDSIKVLLSRGYVEIDFTEFAA